jgi:type III HopA1-like effector protein
MSSTVFLYSEIKKILRCIKIVFEQEFKIELQNCEYDLETELMLNVSGTEENIKQNLKEFLYKIYHCRKISFIKEKISDSHQYNKDFIISLSKANKGSGTNSPGWKVLYVEKDGQFVIEKNNIKLWVCQKDFAGKNIKPIIGKEEIIKFPKEFAALMPGFYLANSNATFDEQNESDILVRIYWNINPNYAAWLTELITSSLNEKEIPFQFKILNNPNYYPRADAAILYLHKNYYFRAWIYLKKIYTNINKYLYSPTPLFAKRLGFGLSLAEDPNNGESFGEYICRILAESLFDTRELNNGFKSEEEIINKIKNYFRIQGINMDNIYLKSHDSRDCYKVIENNMTINWFGK